MNTWTFKGGRCSYEGTWVVRISRGSPRGCSPPEVLDRGGFADGKSAPLSIATKNIYIQMPVYALRLIAFPVSP